MLVSIVNTVQILINYQIDNRLTLYQFYRLILRSYIIRDLITTAYLFGIRKSPSKGEFPVIAKTTRSYSSPGAKYFF